MNIDDFKTDPTAAEEGVWLPFDGAEFLVASSSSTAYQRRLMRAMRKLGPAAGRKPEVILEVTKAALAETCLLGWRGVKQGEQEFPFTPANRATLMSFPDFWNWLSTEAGNTANFRPEDEVEQCKSPAGVDADTRAE